MARSVKIIANLVKSFLILKPISIIHHLTFLRLDFFLNEYDYLVFLLDFNKEWVEIRQKYDV